MANLGLIAGGIGTGLSSFVNTMQDQDRIRAQQQQVANQTAQMQSGLLSKNQVQDPETGQVGLNDLGKQLKSNDAAAAKLKGDANDPNSPISKHISHLVGTFHNFIKSDDNGNPSDEGDSLYSPGKYSAAELTSAGGQDLLEKLSKAKQSADALRASIQYKQANLGMKKAQFDQGQNKDADSAGQTFEKDPIIKTAKDKVNSLKRAQDVLEGNIPVTAPMFAAAQQDVINALDASGRATEGKAAREILNTVAARINHGEAAFDVIKDLRKSQPEFTKNLTDFLKLSKDSLQRQVNDQAGNIAESFSSSSNPKVRDVVKSKLKTYQTPTAESNAAASKIVTPVQLAAYAQQYKMDPKAAAAHLVSQGFNVQQ